MTAPTYQQLRTAQPEDPSFVINRRWLRALDYVVQGRVRRSDAGHDVLAPANDKTGYGSRIRIVDLWRAGLIVLADTGRYQITDVGRRRRQQAIDDYDRESAGGAPTTLQIPRPTPARSIHADRH